MMYGYLSDTLFPLFATFLAGSVLAVAYLGMFVSFTAEKRQVSAKIAGVTCWNALMLLLSFSGSEYLGITEMSKSETGDWVGFIAAATSLLLYASPFATLARAYSTKSVATIPIALVLAGATNSFFWSIYGFMESDMIVAIPNAVCAFFGCIQTTVYYAIITQNTRTGTPGNDARIKKRGDTGSDSMIDLEYSGIVIAIANDNTGEETGLELPYHAAATTPRLQTN